LLSIVQHAPLGLKNRVSDILRGTAVVVYEFGPMLKLLCAVLNVEPWSRFVTPSVADTSLPTLRSSLPPICRDRYSRCVEIFG
jgi:hypothetical protein